MALRTLAEMVYEGESSFYSKASTSYAFGYENCSSGFGSGGGGFKPFDFNVNSVVDVFREKPKSSPSSYGTSSYNSSNGSPSSFGVGSIGSNGSGFESGSFGTIRREVCDGLIERYDFSGHRGTSPHLNQDLFKAEEDFTLKALEDSHHIDLGFGKKKW